MEMKEGFARQRRAWMAASLTLLAYVTAGVSLEQVSVLGNTFSISRPGLVPLAIWIAWAYFGLRYYQFYRDLGDKGPRLAYGQRLDQIALRRARALLPSSLGPAFVGGADPKKVRWTFHDESIEYRGTPDWIVCLSAIARSTGGGTYLASGKRQTVQAGSRLDRIRAWLSVGLHTRFFTEYGLPVLVGSLPVVAWVVLQFVDLAAYA